MNHISHEEQQHIWEEEHRNPFVLLPMDSKIPSSGISLFWKWLKERGAISHLKGVEMGCGKGRNAIFLAEQGIDMTGFDFSRVAIEEATKRVVDAGVQDRAHFVVQDATVSWPFENETFDIAIDCFASTDIESPPGRAFARDEFMRVLKPDGYLFVYTLSTDDEFHKEVAPTSPAEERNAFLHPTTGKFEKVFDQEELTTFYEGLNLIEERRVEKTANFFGKEYNFKHFWLVFQKS